MKKAKYTIALAALLWLLPLLSAQSGFAPVSIRGGMLFATVSSGSGFYSPSGKFIFSPASLGTTYIIFGGPGVEGTVGTYSYSKLSANTAQIVLNDSDLGFSVTQSVTFTSPTSGTYFISNAYGSQSGSFTFTVPQDTTSSDWKYDAYYPWVWNHRNGWQYYLPSEEGLQIYSVSSGTWELKE